MCNMHETWGLIYSRAMRTLPMSYHMVPHVQYMRCAHAGKPVTLCIRGVPGITYGRAVYAS